MNESAELDHATESGAREEGYAAAEANREAAMADDPHPPQAMVVRDAKQAVQALEHPKSLQTVAQAKIEAISNLTTSAYAKASELKLTPEESDALQAPFPDDAFRTGAAGKSELLYLEHSALRERLNRVLGLGQWAIIPRSRWAEDYQYYNKEFKRYENASRVYVEAMLVVRGCFVSESIGDMTYYPKNQSTNYGDAVEGAQSEALRRCCKNFGIGLQAWSKTWCEGWWARKRGGQGVGRTTSNPTPTRPAPPVAKPTPAPATTTSAATEEQKAKMLAMFNPDTEMYAHEFFERVGAILPTDGLEDVPLAFVPTTQAQGQALMHAIDAFASGEEARLPYPKNAPSKPASAAKPTRTVHSSDAAAQPWYSVVVPIPRRNQNRKEYLQSPDTIGSLYDARHTDEAARKRLWGFVQHYEPQGWQKKDGTIMAPSVDDIKFREALDQFAAWLEKRQEKL